MHTATPTAATLADLAAGFPSWHIWRGRDGRGADKGWYATRHRRRLTTQELSAGLTNTLKAENAAYLHDLLAQQQVIEQQIAGGAP
jgi:hypothetical protein